MYNLLTSHGDKPLKRHFLILAFIFLVCSACLGLNQAAAQTAVKTTAPIHSLITPTLAAVRVTPAGAGNGPGEYAPLNQLQPGQRARQHMQALSQEIGNRAANSDGESAAAQYMQIAMKKMGYAPQLQFFSYDSPNGKSIQDANIVIEKKGQSDRLIIIGAHYDSVAVGRGADDNASGVGVMLEAAERVKDLSTPYTLRFIAFASEEEGEKGSNYYVSQMSQADIARTLVMINLDSLAVGDNTYVYGSPGKAGQVRDWTLEKARSLGLPLVTQQGQNPDYPAGTTGDFSDHAPFRLAGIPYAYFEATNWTLGSLDGYVQVDPKFGDKGQIWHTQDDALAYIDSTFPGRVDAHLNLFTTLLVDILTEYKP
jgi:hypothetical protein